MRSENGGIFLALSPIFLLFVIFLLFFTIEGVDCRVPVIAVFTAVAVYAVVICGGDMQERITVFSKGASDRSIVYMIWIFMMAGAFGAVAKAIGAVDATVSATLALVPSEFLPAGLFLSACFISMAVGTSVGTIVVMCPIATEIAGQLSTPAGWFVAIIVSGAFFGDNLSFISDTTIAATQTQGCAMKEKFKANFFLVLPAAAITVLIYLYNGVEMSTVIEQKPFEWFKTVPYILVIVLMLTGMDVLPMLTISLLFTAITGFIYGDFTVTGFCGFLSDGVLGMCELIVVTMLAGGILGVIRHKKGIECAVQAIKRRVKSRTQAEFAIAGMTALADICTANNTIAILTVGDMAKEISSSYSIPARRAASIMDTISCLAQGLIPYGAQLLIAAQIGAVPAAEIIPYLYYPMLTGVIIVISILCRRFFAK